MSLPLILTLAPIAMATISASMVEDRRESFDVAVPEAPIPVRTEGRKTLVYELHLTNFATMPLVVREVRALDDATQKPLTDFGGSSLSDRLTLVGASSPPGAAGSIIAPGARAILYVDFALEPADVPKRLRHVITFAAVGQDATSALIAGSVEVGAAAPGVL